MNTWSKMKKFYAKQLTNKVRATVVKNWQYLKEATCDSTDNSNSNCRDERSSDDVSRPPKDRQLKRVQSCKLMPKLDDLVTM